MAGIDSSLSDLLIKLYEVQAVKFGSFILKSGIESPVYFDLRVIVSYPELLSKVAIELWKVAQRANCRVDCVCGVPYTALPIATCISVNENLPMLIRRKEAKDYGTKKIIEGSYKDGDLCLIIEDVVTSGSSVAETVQVLKEAGLQVSDAIVLLDREQGGKHRLKADGIHLHSVCGISQVLEVLQSAGKLDQTTVDAVRKFISDNNTYNGDDQHQKRKVNERNELEKAKKQKIVLSYSERAEICTHPLTKKLFTIMETKQTNLCFSVDVTSSEKLLKLADQVGPYICVLKTHVDIIEDFSSAFTQDLSNLAQKHSFLIFEDRKFADIGHTVGLQFERGVYHICDWANIINAHAVPGPGIIKGLKQVGLPKNRGCLLIAEMSSEGNLAKEQYTKACIQMAEQHRDFVLGFICTSQVTSDPQFVHMTPGVRIVEGVSAGDGLGQQYLTPDEVITKRLSDIIIVGRGILQSENPAESAKKYQEAGYQAYMRSLPTEMFMSS